MPATPGCFPCSQAFPKLHALEQRYRSLFLGQFLGARERKRSGEVSKQDAKKFSFDDGLQVLIDTLQSRLDGEHSNRRARSLFAANGRWLDHRIGAGRRQQPDRVRRRSAGPAEPQNRLPGDHQPLRRWMCHHWPKFIIRPWPRSCWAFAATTWRIRWMDLACSSRKRKGLTSWARFSPPRSFPTRAGRRSHSSPVTSAARALRICR